MAEIRLQNLHKRFDDFVAVRNTNLTIRDGEFFVLLGPSGCGKTTTLRMIAGLEIPTSGQILLAGDDVTFLRARQRDIAFVFQLFALYPHMNVWNNLAFPLKSQGVARSEIKQRVQEIARMLRIEHLLKSSVGGLAGGDRQRVALGRAIIRRPQAFLMDEPLGTLDTEFRELMCEELRQLHERINATTVYVTHDQIEAMAMADTIAVMDQGEVLQAASPSDIYRRPVSKFVASFIGSPAMNFLPAQGPLVAGASEVRLRDARIAIPTLQQGTEHETVTLGIRPEHIRLSDEHCPLRGEVLGGEYLGVRQVLTVETPVGRLKVRVANHLQVNTGERVGLQLPKEQLIVFDDLTGRALPGVPTLHASEPSGKPSAKPNGKPHEAAYG